MDLILTLIVILLLGIPVFVYLYFSSLTSSQRKQIVMLSRQNTDLRSKINKQVQLQNSVSITYKSSEFKNGIIKETCNLYLAPLDGTPILFKLPKDSIVDVMDSGEILGKLWYEVNLSAANRINTKGWIKSTDIEPIVFTTPYEDS